MDADDAGPKERLRVEDRAVDVGLGGDVDDGVGAVDERPDDVRVRDVALDEREAGGLLGIALDGREVRAVAGVGELVEHGHARPVVAAEDLADELAADEAGAAGDQEVGVGRGLGGHRGSSG